MLKKAIRQIAHSLGYEIVKSSELSQPVVYPLVDLLDLIVRFQLQQSSDFFFIQIGANDGKSSDPIYRLIKQHHWRGILVEPQPQIFAQLQETYANEPQLIFENAVLSDRDGTAEFYSVSDELFELPEMLKQIASLDRDRVLAALSYWEATENRPNLPQPIETMLKTSILPALTISTLLQKHQVQNLDLLVLDTVGFDFEILKMFPFEQIKPAIIHFEHSLMPLQTQAACLSYLAEQGYGLAKVAVDTIACLNTPIRRWGMSRW